MENRARGRPHPSLNLQQALHKVGDILETHDRGPIAPRAISDAWGLTYTSSGFRRTLSALLQYGLLEPIGRGEDKHVKVSKTAVDALGKDGMGLEARQEALRKAALSPVLYADLWKRSKHTLPSMAYIGDYVVNVAGSLPAAVPQFANNYRATIKFAGLVDESSEDETVVSNEAEHMGEPVPMEIEGERSKQTSNPSSETWEDSVPTSDGRRALIQVPLYLSEEDFDLVTEMLQGSVERLKKMRRVIARNRANG